MSCHEDDDDTPTSWTDNNYKRVIDNDNDGEEDSVQSKRHDGSDMWSRDLVFEIRARAAVPVGSCFTAAQGDKTYYGRCLESLYLLGALAPLGCASLSQNVPSLRKVPLYGPRAVT